jgi:hypothetical protein
MPVTREEIRFGYLFILGREPESERAYETHARHQDIGSLRSSLMLSSEGERKVRSVIDSLKSAPLMESDREAVCFIHLEKTAGTTLYGVLRSLFKPERVSPPHVGQLSSYSLSALSNFDLISGHFDFYTSQFIPRPRVRRISIFREPAARLISFYRFHRAHPANEEARNGFVELARRLSPEEFFQHEAVIRSPRLNNAYLRTFGTSSYQNVQNHEQEDHVTAATQKAIKRIKSLDSLGLTEKMRDSIRLICVQLGKTPPESFESMHVTNDFVLANQLFSRAEEISLTDRILACLEPLTRGDQIIYNVVKKEFEERYAKLDELRPLTVGERS